METEPDLIRDAVAALHRRLSAEVSFLTETEGPNELRIGAARGRVFVVECKMLRPGTAAVVGAQTRRMAGEMPVVIITQYASPAVDEALRAMNIQFIDAAGNARLEIPGATVIVSGQKPAAGRPHRTGAVGGAAWRVAFILLSDPDAANLPVRKLGARAGVSHGAAAEALDLFDGRGWIAHMGTSGHPVAAREAFLDAWLQGFADRLASSLELARVRPTSALSEWAPSKGPLLGGELAAQRGGLGVRPATGSVYVSVWDGAAVRSLRAAPDPTGPVVVRQRFCEGLADPSDPALVHPLIVLAELSMIPDSRLDDAREALRRRLLASP